MQYMQVYADSFFTEMFCQSRVLIVEDTRKLE